jgi:hypothetical protein
VSNVPSVLSESYDEVLEAVRESSRGRWFLEEYASRLRHDDSKSILDAIHKLEAAIGDMPTSKRSDSNQHADKVKRAIEGIRKQISNAGTEGKPLSEEAQMFSHLADLARSAFSGHAAEVRPEVRRGIELALRVVQDIENEIRGVAAPAASAPAVSNDKPKPASETQKYFQQDADMFAPPVHSKLATPDKPQIDEGTGKGARLKVLKIDSRSGQQGTPEATAAAATNTGHVPLPEPTNAEQKPRITIIRRKPEELMQVPLADTVKSETAA